MSWDTRRKLSGKLPFNFVELEIARCIRTYGTAPCTAVLGTTGTAKCLNGWETCQDRANYSAASFWVRLSDAVADLPQQFTFADDGLPFFLPMLRGTDHQPGLPNPGETMGMRTRFTAQLLDSPHHDVGLDKYVTERNFEDSISKGFESDTWAAGVSPVGYGLNQNTAGESTWEVRDGPFGYQEVVNVCRSLDNFAGEPGPDGGWDLGNSAFPVNNAQKAVFAVFMRHRSGATFTGSSAYWGLHSNSASDVLELVAAGGGSNTNPYFHANGTLTLLPTADKWYLVIGLVHENGYAGADAGISGVYDPVTGVKVVDGFEYRWPADTTRVGHRCYHYYNQTISGEAQNMTRPRVFQCATVAQATEIIHRLRKDGYAPAKTSTFLRKLKARFPHYIGKRLRWYQGYLGTHRVFRFTGTSGNWLSTPDSAAVSQTGDRTMIAKLRYRDWSLVSTLQAIASQDNYPNDFAFFWYLEGGGNPVLSWTTGGTTATQVQATCNATIESVAKNNDVIWLKVTLKVANPWQVIFWYSFDGVTWKQLGSTVNGGAGTSVFDSSQTFKVGGLHQGFSYPPTGDIEYFELRSGIDGAVVARVAAEDASVGAASVVSKATGETWTLNTTNPALSIVDSQESHLDDFRKREYIIEKIEGPDAKGRVSIICKDVIKLVDNDRAQWPAKSKGSLSAALTAGATPSTLDINTTDLTEYNLTGGDTVGYVRIGDEIIQYTGTSLPGGNVVRLSGVTRAAPSPYVTTPAAHDAGDLVQRCRYMTGTVAAVVEQLMLNGGMDASFIPTAEWAVEAEAWGSDAISRLITEPEGIQDLINEIIEQTLTWGFWFEETEQKIKYRALRPLDVGVDTAVVLNDPANVVAGSVVVKDEPEKAINEVQVLYGQINPTESKDDIKNYRAGYVTVDTDSQSDNEIGQRRVKRVFARWHPTGNAGVVSRWAERTLRAKAKNLVSVEFKMERKDEGIPTSQFADLTTLYIVDQFGLPRTLRVQVVRANASGELMTYKAREDFFKGVLFGRWAPESLSGLDYDDATALQKAKYIFWANDTGLMNNGDSGKGWL